MLVLTRHVGDTVRLIIPPSDRPTAIDVVVTEMRHLKMRLGFAAPRQVSIHRAECLDADGQPVSPATPAA